MQAHFSSPLRCATPCLPSSSWCGTAHPILLLWHYSMPAIFVAWHCTSHHSPVVLVNNSHLSGMALHIPSSHACTAHWLPSSWCGAAHIPSSCDTTQHRRSSWWCTAMHTPVLNNSHLLVWPCTSHHPTWVQLNDSHISDVTLHIPSSSVAPLNAGNPRGVALHIPSSSVAPLKAGDLRGVALHIPSSSVVPLNASDLRGVTLHIKLVVPWHYVTIPIIMVWRCTSHHPPVVILNASHLSDAVLYIPSSSSGNTLRLPSFWCGAVHPIILQW